MPKNKFQAAVFGVIMSYAMAIGMEVYNVALREGVQLTPGGLSNMTNSVFLGALEEAWYMGLLVVLFSNLWGNRLGAAIGARWCDAGRDSPAFCQLMRQAGTVAVMCPTMSLAATILFYGILGGTPVFLEYGRRVPVHPLGLPAALCGQRLTAFCGKKRPAFVHGDRALSVYWNCWMYRAERRNRQYT